LKKYIESLANSLFDMNFGDLNEAEQNVIEKIAKKEPIASNVNEHFKGQLTFGQRMADKVAEFGGSWTFILIFLFIMVAWIGINAFALVSEPGFDPYPFILLNLVLSTLAALQAPIIMMSQNRQSSKDRLVASRNYEVSLKTDLEIMLLNKKIDQMITKLDASSLS